MGWFMRIRWTNELATGVRTIDLQHEELIGMLNELGAAYAAGQNLSVLDDVLQRLTAYTIFHFGTEEALMTSLKGRPDFEEHCQQHRRFIEELSRMRDQSSADTAGAMKDLIDFLNAWLYEHILKSDRTLAACLNEQNAKMHMKEH